MPVFLLALSFILVHVAGVTGCSCGDTDAQTKYCQSAYVVVARVNDFTFEEGVELDNAGRTYDVDILKVYKGDVNKGPAKVRTSGVASLCGVRLKRGNTYLLNGNFENRQNPQMWIYSCGMIRFGQLVDTDTPSGFDPSYDCRCKKENILLEEGQPKPTRVCDLGNRVLCRPSHRGASRKLAECRYNKFRDDCYWQC